MNKILPFDPDDNKVPNDYGGYNPNERGITQYPRYSGKPNPTDCSFQGPFPTREQTSRTQEPSDPMLDPVTKHFRKFVQDPGLPKPVPDLELKEEPSCMPTLTKEKLDSSSCCPHRKPCSHDDKVARLKKPIDPIHWKPDLFDNDYEKYYLKNLINENPYRPFLKSYSENTKEPLYFTEYKERFSGNPTLSTSSLKSIPGLSRPTDITQSCDWRRNRTSKLRDVIFTQDKDPIDSHLDYNAPQRYNPWGRHLAGHELLIQQNYRPRASSGIQYRNTTVLATVEPKSMSWIV